MALFNQEEADLPKCKTVITQQKKMHFIFYLRELDFRRLCWWQWVKGEHQKSQIMQIIIEYSRGQHTLLNAVLWRV